MFNAIISAVSYNYDIISKNPTRCLRLSTSPLHFNGLPSLQFFRTSTFIFVLPPDPLPSPLFCHPFYHLNHSSPTLSPSLFYPPPPPQPTDFSAVLSTNQQTSSLFLSLSPVPLPMLQLQSPPSPLLYKPIHHFHYSTTQSKTVVTVLPPNDHFSPVLPPNT